MKHKVTIGAVLMALILLFTGTVYGIEMGPSAIDEQTAKSDIKIKCDPCDYNIDYGNTLNPSEKGGIDEGFVKLECDPCDYNIDYGDTHTPEGK